MVVDGILGLGLGGSMAQTEQAISLHTIVLETLNVWPAPLGTV